MNAFQLVHTSAIRYHLALQCDVAATAADHWTYLRDGHVCHMFQNQVLYFPCHGKYFQLTKNWSQLTM